MAQRAHQLRLNRVGTGAGLGKVGALALSCWPYTTNGSGFLVACAVLLANTYMGFLVACIALVTYPFSTL